MYFKRFMETLTECEIEINEAKLECMSIHPYEIISDRENVLQEAFNFKEKAEFAFNKIVKVFTDLSKKFYAMASVLKKENKDWIESASRFDINRVDLKDFKHEMFDYRKGVEGIESRIKKVISYSNSWEELIQNIKTKRYTYNKIGRKQYNHS